jgi:hypothetical protein
MASNMCSNVSVCVRMAGMLSKTKSLEDLALYLDLADRNPVQRQADGAGKYSACKIVMLHKFMRAVSGRVMTVPISS